MTAGLTQPRPGSIVHCRGRDWTVVPSGDPDVILLRPLGGGDTLTGIYAPLITRGVEHLEPSSFPLPNPESAGDYVGGTLLHEAARLLLRDGAAPLRCLGKVSFRPRAYQFVPLLMALRLQPVRLLVADDVGVGKTIEALLVARELLDRGEIRRLAVLCPPYLCDQWQSEMREKFGLDAVVVRPGTLGRLEREVPADQSVYGYYPYIVASIDYVKSERQRPAFLQHCPELVIVDEAHGAAEPPGQRREQQMRHDLLKAIASVPSRHLILLTATPHSGIESSFQSLLALLRPEFRDLDIGSASEDQVDTLARHFLQRRRADVERWIEDTRFPRRKSEEATYRLSPAYLDLFQGVFEVARNLVRRGDQLGGRGRRLCYWSALALLRSVMSSPAAAAAALQARFKEEPESAADVEAPSDVLADSVFDPMEREATEDAAPTAVIEETSAEIRDVFQHRERERFREFARKAADIKDQALRGIGADAKVDRLTEVVDSLLRQGFNIIVWCRYIPTADYVAEVLKARLGPTWPGLAVDSVTGSLPEEARRERVEALGRSQRRVLVATDCLSEGINLQDHFQAVVHYDLPWNPNRLEQREGRVDRFGQDVPVVKAILLYGSDNPVDGAVLDVLVRKARQIRQQLGVSVPVPEESVAVVEAILSSLFQRWREPAQQLRFDQPEFLPDEAQRFLREWDRAVQREGRSRARFAQRSIDPSEVQRELEATDSVLGDPQAVQRFLRRSLTRLGASYQESGDLWVIQFDSLPAPVRDAVGERPQSWRITFRSPPPRELGDVEVVGRNHPLVVALAEHVLAGALEGTSAVASRCGAIFTRHAQRVTVLYLLRLRFLMHEEGKDAPLLAEEALTWGISGSPDAGQPTPVDPPVALGLLHDAEPAANMAQDERVHWVERALAWWERSDVQALAGEAIARRAQRVAEAQRRVRRLVRQGQVRIDPCLPPDLLGVYVMVPAPGR